MASNLVHQGIPLSPLPAAVRERLFKGLPKQEDLKNRRIIGPQQGPQELFLRNRAAICVFGGQAGGGKSFGLQLGAVRYIQHPNWSFVILRRERVQVDKRGGLWDESQNIFPHVGGVGHRHKHEWAFPSGCLGQYGHLENADRSHFDWDGAQVCYFGMDECQHFEEHQFYYMLSRNRSAAGLPCMMRVTCNPKPDSWLSRLLQWWWDPDTGYPIEDRSGVIRWMVRLGDELVWGDSKLELVNRYAPEWVNNPDDPRNPIRPMSFCFIKSELSDNPKMLEKDPGYAARLRLLPRVEQERLLKGNWKIVAGAGDYFDRNKVDFADQAPESGQVTRGWDQAATRVSGQNPDPDYTVGVKIKRVGDRYFVCDVVRFRDEPHVVNDTIRRTAHMDGGGCKIALIQDPAAAGKQLYVTQVGMLSGFVVVKVLSTKDKVTNALPFASQWGAGNVTIVRGPWNDVYLNEMHAFGDGTYKDDQVDASSAAFSTLWRGSLGSLGLNV